MAAHEARLSLLEAIDPVPAEYSLFKDEVSLGRGEDNDVVIPHASVSRAHARLMRRNGVFELIDLNSTNGSYVNEQPVHGSVQRHQRQPGAPGRRALRVCAFDRAKRWRREALTAHAGASSARLAAPLR